MEHKEFREFYRFCFKFNREGAEKKTLEKEMVGQLLPMILGDRSAFTSRFVTFLATAPMARVSADEWNSFLEFSKEFGEKGLGAYDSSDGAWPSLLDDFVDWAAKNKE
jgi:DCN1-like protein 1/2